MFFVLVISVFWTACNNEAGKTSEEPLARVYDKYLYPSDLKGILKRNMSPQDSALVVSTYVENWGKDNLMLHVAEENVPNDIDIDEMVREYRQNLIQLHYERNLVKQRLDTFVSNEEVRSYYEVSKQDHVLKQNVVRCFFLKAPNNSPDLEEAKKWWKMENDLDKTKLEEFAEKFAQIYILEDSTWVRENDLAAQFNGDALKEGSLTKGKEIIIDKQGYLYLLKIHEVAKKGEIAPMGFIKKKAKSYILLKRKMALIEDMASEMYKREINKKNVVIYQ
ncbi:MAG: hypothetical protein ACPGXZ_04590 [Saprospiraceae bacterium]